METVKMNIKNHSTLYTKKSKQFAGEGENLRFFREKTQKNVTKSLF